MAPFTIGVLSVHSSGRTKENNGKLCSIQATPDYKSVSWSLLASTLISISAKFVHRCTSFENSATENVCVVWIICKIVMCILSSASVRRLVRKSFYHPRV
jgi:hypothetical protein